MPALVQISDAVCRISSTRTLRIESMQLHRGEHWCFFGGNGTGKSLLVRLICGQLRLGSAHVSYGPGFSPNMNIQLVSFEEQQRLWELENRHDISEFSGAQDQGTTVEALIRPSVGACPAGEKLPRSDRDYQTLTSLLNLTDLQHKGIRFLSSGQLRKAMIARALYADPPLIILDDPLESIDRESRFQIAEAIGHWQDSGKDSGRCSITLSRRQADIPPGVTHMALMADLAIIRQGPVHLVRKSAEFQRHVNNEPAPVRLPELAASQAAELQQEGGGALIELKNVCAAWGERAVLEDINWTFRSGDHALIEGPNGCGKSTLLSLINGENHKAYGQDVRLFGRRRGSGESVWDIKTHFGVVSNEMHNRYVRGWRALEVVISGFFDTVGLYDDSGAPHQLAAQAWLDALGLGRVLRDSYAELSFGQQRLVLLARAMVKWPRILILDEPTVGLDDWHRKRMLQALDAIAATGRTQLIYVSHTDGEHPHCITQHLQFIPRPLPPVAVDPGSIHSRSPYRLVIQQVQPAPWQAGCDRR